MPYPCELRSHGNLTLSTQLIANGADGGDHTSETEGKIGGYSGGGKDSYRHGKGPGKGSSRQDSSEDGTGGAYGNEGVKPGHTTSLYGNTNGDYFITDLLGGSGGGGGRNRAGGAGGGAIELIAHGMGVLKLNAGSRISVNGGDTSDNDRGGGGGAGGSIRLQGGSIENNGELQARGGGLEPGGKADMDGTGGRISFDSNGTVKIGNYDLSGHYMGRDDRAFLRYPTLDGTVSIRGNSGITDLSYSSGTLTIDTSVVLVPFRR